MFLRRTHSNGDNNRLYSQHTSTNSALVSPICKWDLRLALQKEAAARTVVHCERPSPLRRPRRQRRRRLQQRREREGRKPSDEPVFNRKPEHARLFHGPDAMTFTYRAKQPSI